MNSQTLNRLRKDAAGKVPGCIAGDPSQPKPDPEIRRIHSIPCDERNFPVFRADGSDIHLACILFLRDRVAAVASSLPSWNEPKTLSHGISAVP